MERHGLPPRAVKGPADPLRRIRATKPETDGLCVFPPAGGGVGPRRTRPRRCPWPTAKKKRTNWVMALNRDFLCTQLQQIKRPGRDPNASFPTDPPPNNPPTHMHAARPAVRPSNEQAPHGSSPWPRPQGAGPLIAAGRGRDRGQVHPEVAFSHDTSPSNSFNWGGGIASPPHHSHQHVCGVKPLMSGVEPKPHGGGG